MKFVCLTLILLSTIASCTKKNNDDLYLAFIGQGNLYGNGGENIPEGNRLIEKEKDWEALLSQINSVNNESEAFTETDINFKDFILVACFDKIRPSGGYAIEATEIQTSGDYVDIIIQKSEPLEIAASVITQPFFIAKIPKTKSDIRFQ